VWKELLSGGHINFLTGAGGFLQNVLFGYAGLQLYSWNLTVAPILPPYASAACVSQLKYLNATLELCWDQRQVTIELLNYLPDRQKIYCVANNGTRKELIPRCQFAFSHSCTIVSETLSPLFPK